MRVGGALHFRSGGRFCKVGREDRFEILKPVQLYKVCTSTKLSYCLESPSMRVLACPVV